MVIVWNGVKKISNFSRQSDLFHFVGTPINCYCQNENLENQYVAQLKIVFCSLYVDACVWPLTVLRAALTLSEDQTGRQKCRF